MRKVRISELKAKLSEYIRFAKTGESVMVMDRDRPVALLSSISGTEGLQEIPPEKPLQEAIKEMPSIPVIKQINGVAELIQDRRRR